MTQNYQKILDQVAKCAIKCGRDPGEITVVAVSKTHPLSELQEVYLSGCRHFGEARVAEALDKMESAPADIFWHLIGTLQKNKVAKVIGKFDLIHSVDNFELAKKISEASGRSGVKTIILLQVNTSGEASKHGLSEEEWLGHWKLILSLPRIQVKGLMTMAPLTEDERLIRSCFSRLRMFRDQLLTLSPENYQLPHLSMGMSHDYQIAIEEGATLLRIGTAIFGINS